MLDPDVEELFGRFRAKGVRRLLPSELRGEAIAAAAFLVAAIPLAVLAPWRPEMSVPVALVLGGLYALASRVRFEVGSCHTDASQLVLVPMLLLLPAACVPLLVALSYAAGELPDYLLRRRHPERVVVALANSWYALGPALVLTVAGGAQGLEDWPLLLGALAAQFAVDAMINGPREWLELGASPRAQLAGASWTYAVDALLATVGLLAAVASWDEAYAFVLLLPLLALLSLFAKEREQRLDAALELGDAYRGTTHVLAEVVECDDEYTGFHSQQVVSIAVATADALGLDAKARRNVEFGALLHDIGKISVPNKIINKAGPLDDGEWAVIKRHTINGQRMLDRVGGLLTEVGVVVRSSHERWDGRGYPDGLAGEEIPVEARVVACCDAFNAMTTDRSYRNALPVCAAVDELRNCAGSQFDPRVTEQVVEIVSRRKPAARASAAHRGPEPTGIGAAGL